MRIKLVKLSSFLIFVGLGNNAVEDSGRIAKVRKSEIKIVSSERTFMFYVQLCS